MGKSQRIKGHSFERKVAIDFREFSLCKEAKRGIQSRNRDDPIEDVVVPLFHIECKAHKVAPIRAALQQAIEDSEAISKGVATKIPVAVLKDDYKEPFISMRYSDFLSLAGFLLDNEVIMAAFNTYLNKDKNETKNKSEI